MADTRNLVPTVLYPERLTPAFLSQALAEWGVARISDALPLAEASAFMREARAAFDLPEEAKARCRRFGTESGYTPPSVEGVIGHGPDPLRHFWDVTRDAPQIRQEAPGFYKQSARLWTRLSSLGARALEAFDAAHGTHVFLDARGGAHSLRTSEYLNRERSPEEVLFPAHVDFSLFTLYVGGPADGLQVELHGHWYDLWNPPGGIVIGAGTTMRMYAPGKCTPLRHRVMGASVGRLSSVYFVEPRAEVVLPNGLTWEAHLENLMKKVRSE